MPKIKINFPQKYFDIPIDIPVRITDINYGNHVGNDSIIGIIHEARVQFLQFYGYTELNIEGIGLIMSALSVEFKNESFYKDIISIQIACSEISKVSFELFYSLSTIRDNREITIAKAVTTMVCYDYIIKKVSALPKKLQRILQR